MNAGIILFLIFAVCVLIGVPISMSLGIGSLAAVALGLFQRSMIRLLQRRCLEKEWQSFRQKERFMLRQMARSVWYLIHSMQSALYLKKGQRF